MRLVPARGACAAGEDTTGCRSCCEPMMARGLPAHQAANLGTLRTPQVQPAGGAGDAGEDAQSAAAAGGHCAVALCVAVRPPRPLRQLQVPDLCSQSCARPSYSRGAEGEGVDMAACACARLQLQCSQQPICCHLKLRPKSPGCAVAQPGGAVTRVFAAVEHNSHTQQDVSLPEAACHAVQAAALWSFDAIT